MRSQHRWLVPVVLLLVLHPALRAQADRSDDIIEEKTRWTPEQVQQALRERAAHPQGVERSAVEPAVPGPRESVASGDEAPESEVHAVINPTDSNNILVSPIHIGAAGTSISCPVYYTKDFGVTWHKSSYVTMPKGLDVVINGGGDPMMVFDESGRAYLAWIGLFTNGDTSAYGLYWVYSDDGGVTWKQPDKDAVSLTQYLRGTGNPEVYDKEWFAADRTAGSTRNTLYLAFLQTGGSFGNGRIVVRRKDPTSMEFALPPVAVSDASFSLVQFASIDVDAEARVHVTFFGGKGSRYSMWHSVSADGGRTFSAPVKISDIHHPRFSSDATYNSIPGITSRRIYPCPQFAIDRSAGPHHGTLYSVWSADGITSDLRNGLDVYLSRSVDNGMTWSTPIVVNDDPRGRFRHQHYPSIAVNNDGVVAVSFYDRRSDSANRITNYSVAYSFDGGASFTHTIPVAAKPTDFSTVGLQNSLFGIGEYTQVMTTKGYAIPVWTDGRSNDGNLNIYAAFVPLSSDAAGVERMTTIDGGVRLSAPVIAGDRAEVAFTATGRTHARIELYDGAGRLTQVVADADYEAGTHQASMALAGLASGRYHLLLDSPLGRATQQLTIVR